MSKAWPMVPLGNVINYRKEFVEIDDLETYKRCRVQLHTQGIVLRDVVPGAEIKTKKQQVCKSYEFLVAEIDAKVGGYGIVPDELEGAIVSSHYFLFQINEALLNKSFLNYYIRTPYFREQVAAQGSTNYAAIRPKDVLGYKIPLPTLSEQKRIIARLEDVATRIEEARSLRRQSAEEIEALCRSIVFGDPNAALTPMHELVKSRSHDIQVKADQVYHFAGVYCFGRGIFRSQKKSGLDFAYKQLCRLNVGNFVYPKLMAWEGALAVVSKECDGLYVSPEFPVFEVDENRVLPETLDVYFRTPSIWSLLSGASTGTNVRRRRLNPKDFLNFKVTLPTMQTQLRLRQIIQKTEALKRLQMETEAELNAMLPSVLDKAFNRKL